MIILPYKDKTPVIDGSTFIAPNASVIGDVTIGSDSGIWFGCTVRGDVNDIKIGSRTNIQDHTIIHVSSTTQGTYVGDNVTVGHGAILHACTVGDLAFIGMQACVMDDAVVEEEAMVGAGALVPQGKVVKRHQLWMGRPAVYVRDLTAEEIESFAASAENYYRLSREYMP